MKTEDKLQVIIKDLVNQKLSGVTYTNIERGLIHRNLQSELIKKLMRLMELEIIIKGC